MNGWDDTITSYWRTIVWTALVMLVGSLVPSPFQRRPQFSRFGPDKIFHFLGHARLTVVLAEAFSTGRLTVVQTDLLAVGVSFVYGLVIGSLQRYVPGRAPERADLVSGLLGAVVGVLWWHHRHSK
ncbi:VanZ family protein [Salinibaculum salinum]|uniref:VanZ family protein n=1 Tax=Salinibaculum salinum TaxID=3131996 RepID=UPI0030ED7EBD